MTAPAHRDLVALAEEELALVEGGRFDELAALGARRAALLAALGQVPPASARADLERAAAAQARVTDALRGALAGGDPSAAQFAVTTDPSAPVRADGGTVDPDVESATLAKNGLEYETLTTVAKARLSILEAAIGNGR